MSDPTRAASNNHVPNKCNTELHLGRDGDRGGRSGGADVVVGVEIGDC